MDFSLRLKDIREKNNITQTQFAKIFDIGVSTIGMWESSKRKPPAEMLLKIADYFNVTVDYLLGRENAEKFPDTSNTNHNGTIVKILPKSGERLEYVIPDENINTFLKIVDSLKKE
jgi:transcriptional regulator with XRE-family HTH domain